MEEQGIGSKFLIGGCLSPTVVRHFALSLGRGVGPQW